MCGMQCTLTGFTVVLNRIFSLLKNRLKTYWHVPARLYSWKMNLEYPKNRSMQMHTWRLKSQGNTEKHGRAKHGNPGPPPSLRIFIQFLWSDGECYYSDKTIDFFHIFSDVAIGPENSPSLNWNIIDCYVILLISTFKVHLTPKLFFSRDETVQHSHKEFDNFISIWYF